MLGNQIELYTAWSWLPFEIVQGIDVVVWSFPTGEEYSTIFILSGLHAAALFKDPLDDSWVVTWLDNVL